MVGSPHMFICPNMHRLSVVEKYILTYKDKRPAFFGAKSSKNEGV